jgi:hypothetical protein
VPSPARHEWAKRISEFVLGHGLKPTAKFQHSPGTVRTNDFGADLSEFMYHEVELVDPLSRPLSELKYYVTQCLGLHPETHTVGLHALWTKSSTNIHFFF